MPQYTYSMKWDNIVIVLVALVVTLAATPLVFKLVGDAERPAPVSKAKDLAKDDPKIDPDPTLTLEDAQRIVAEARTAMLAGRFEEAARLLEQIGGDISDTSGASALRDENAQRHQQFQDLTSRAMTALSEERWADVKAAIAELRTLGPVSSELRRAEERANQALSASAIVQRIETLATAGKSVEALTLAERAYSRNQTQQLAALISQLRDEVRAGGGNAAATGSTATQAGAATGGGSSSTTHQHHAGGGAAGGAANVISGAGNASTADLDRLLGQLGGTNGLQNLLTQNSRYMQMLNDDLG